MRNDTKVKDIVVLIPALNPDEKMVVYVNKLIEVGFAGIVLVDDGSDQKHQVYFEQLQPLPQVTVLHHEQNRGKGRALKTGFEWCLQNMPDCQGIVTADSDGQHGPEDTMRVAEALVRQPSALILGIRDFNLENVPFKSRFGNKLTTVIFALLYGKWLCDTQTGLRGIPYTLLPALCSLSGERFEYEIRVLIYAAKHKIDVCEITIETIYIHENEETHFDPVIDSIKIYKVLFGLFFRYLIASLSSFLIDMGIFALLNTFLFAGWELKTNIIASTVCARVISSLYNFMVNRNLVFGAEGKLVRHFLRYYALVIAQMACSAVLVYVFTKAFSGGAVGIKIIVDTCLFVISYQIQQRIVFAKS